MQSKSHTAILKIAKKEAQERGYKGGVKSYKLDMEGAVAQVVITMENGDSFTLPATSLRDDDDFRNAALETKRLKG